VCVCSSLVTQSTYRQITVRVRGVGNSCRRNSDPPTTMHSCSAKKKKENNQNENRTRQEKEEIRMQSVERDQKKKKKKVMMAFKLMPSRQLGPKNNNTHLATCQKNLHLVLFFQKDNTNKLLFSFRVLLCAGISGRDKRPAARWHSLDIFFVVCFPSNSRPKNVHLVLF